MIIIIIITIVIMIIIIIHRRVNYCSKLTCVGLLTIVLNLLT